MQKNTANNVTVIGKRSYKNTSASSLDDDDEQRVPFLSNTAEGCDTNSSLFHDNNNDDESAIIVEDNFNSHNININEGGSLWCCCNISLGSVANLCSAMLGAGVLVLPYAFYQAGFLAGTALLIGAAWSTISSINLLVRSIDIVSKTTNRRRHNDDDHYNRNNNNDENEIETGNSSTDSDNDDPIIFTYEELVEVVLGSRARIVVEILIIVCCVGCAVAYTIAIHDILNQISMLPTYSIYIVYLFIMLPLSSLRTMKSLQCCSSIGVAGIMTLIFSAIVHLFLLHNEADTDGKSGSNNYHTNSYTYDFDYRHHNHPKSYYYNSNYNSPDTDMKYYNKNSENAYFSSSLQQQSTNNNTTDIKEIIKSFLYPANGVISILIACPIILFAFFCQVNVAAIFEEIIILEKIDKAEKQQTNSDNHNRQQQQQYRSNNTIDSSTNNRSNSTSIQNMKNVTCASVVICTLLYLGISIVSLMDFGTDITPNLLSSYNPESFMQVAFAAMTLSIIVAFPLNVFPARVSLQGMIFNNVSLPINNNDLSLTTPSSSSPRSVILEEQHHQLQTQIAQIQTHEEQQKQKTAALAAVRAAAFVSTTTPFDNNDDGEENTSPMRILEEPLLSPFAQNDNDGLSSRRNCCRSHPIILQQQQQGTIVTSPAILPSSEDTPFLIQHMGLTLFITGVALFLALLVPNISVVFGLLGGTTSSVLGLILPGLISIKLKRLHRRTTNRNDNDGSSSVISAWVLFIGGTLVGVVTTGVTIYNTII